MSQTSDQDSAGTQCPSCGKPNQADSRFCTSCGQPMGRGMLDTVDKPDRPTARLTVPPDVESAVLMHVRPSRETAEHQVGGELVIGRNDGQITVPDDPFLSGRHAEIRRDDERFLLRDLDSRNGTFVRVSGVTTISDVTQIAVGGQMLRFYPDGRIGAGGAELIRLDERGEEGAALTLTDGEARIGCNTGDLAFPHDKLLSDPHAEISKGGAGYILRDLGSRTGTFVRIRGDVELENGAVFTAGQQVFRLTLPSPNG